jgi:glycosyltransferase involved in cell wall biosynthesis
MLSNAQAIMRASVALRERPNIVLAPSVPPLTGLVGLFLARRYGAAYVHEVRDVWPAALVDYGAMKRSTPIYVAFRAIEKLLYKRADRISSVFPHLHAHVSASGADPRKLVWLPNGINLSGLPRDDDYSGGTDHNLHVMYVGGFGTSQDIESILKAAKLLQDAGESAFTFSLVGGGVKENEYRQKAEMLGLKNVRFQGTIPKSEVHKAQLSADILIATINDAKAYRFGINLNKLLGYFASSRPVIFGGNTTYDPVKEAQAGISVPAHSPQLIVDALHELRKLGARQRAALGRNGRKFLEERLEISVLGKRMDQMIREMTAARRGN